MSERVRIQYIFTRVVYPHNIVRLFTSLSFECQHFFRFIIAVFFNIFFYFKPCISYRDLEKLYFFQVLEEAKSIFDTSNRPKARKVLVLFIDKKSSNSPGEIIRAARPLEEDKVKVIPVAMGNEADMGELDHVTPEKDNAMKGSNDEDPAQFGNRLMHKVFQSKFLLSFLSCKGQLSKSLNLPLCLNAFFLPLSALIFPSLPHISV